MLDTINLILLSNIVIYLGFAGFLFKRGKKKAVVNSYLFVIFSAIFWTTAMIIFRSMPQSSSLFWCKVLYVVAIFPSYGLYLFSQVFPYGELPKIKQTAWTVIVSLTIAILVVLPGLIIKRVDIHPGLEKVIIWGNLYFLYFLYISGIIGYGLITLLRKYFKESGIVRAQLKYIFWGYFFGSGMAMFPNLLLPWMGIFKINWMGQILGIITIALTVYAIIAHRFMDIKLVLRKTSVFTASIITIIIPALFFDYLVRNYFTEIPSNIVTFSVIILAVLIFPSIKNYYYRLANKYFFSSLYDARQVIAELSEKLRSTLDISMIYDFVSGMLTNAFHAKAAGILTLDETSKKYVTRHNAGFATGGQNKFAGNKFLHEEYISKNRSIVAEELKSDKRPETAATMELLNKMGVEVLTPLNIKDKTIGLIALGPKESGDMYNDEDLQVLEIVGAQTAIAMENALLYDETRKFNINLKREVERATRDLRNANDQLKKLDQAKSDFISIASHQLRTPLTVIKGYVSMILEGNFGDLSPAEKDSLEIVFQSNERLIRLVENLLNISRIESGRLQYSLATVPLEKITDSVVEELTNYIKKNGLKFIYKKPTAPLPLVKIDEEKIRQVVLNLIDNAAKYTKQGSITVSLKKADGNIVFTVSDSGIGIKPEDLPNLFKKFSRGTGTSLVHTEGTGLGLYVARMMIEAHNGMIWAESDGEGRGSRFSFSLPVVSS